MGSTHRAQPTSSAPRLRCGWWRSQPRALPCACHTSCAVETAIVFPVTGQTATVTTCSPPSVRCLTISCWSAQVGVAPEDRIHQPALDDGDPASVLARAPSTKWPSTSSMRGLSLARLGVGELCRGWLLTGYADACGRCVCSAPGDEAPPPSGPRSAPAP